MRLNAQLSPAWEKLKTGLSTQNDKQALARFSQWCSLREIAPGEVDDSTITKYREALLQRSFVKNGEKHVLNLIRSWNACAAMVEGRQDTKITPFPVEKSS
ncbi:hypothetical protein DS909_03155 [Phaeobacter gallaeciensis]|uniref:Core-binding (CB) domain-containing protein n=1 Tax=Phaeobacter gallaeciensis TaxID=60890 RepID=A0A366X6M2_9RHOB|nr:hypothetical protein [Phaeobacter gallaeciensis]RBW60861.1 hypothetical protein DS909_03155 [Phaeobacter gallaeciensis]